MGTAGSAIGNSSSGIIQPHLWKTPHPPRWPHPDHAAELHLCEHQKWLDSKFQIKKQMKERKIWKKIGEKSSFTNRSWIYLIIYYRRGSLKKSIH